MSDVKVKFSEIEEQWTAEDPFEEKMAEAMINEGSPDPKMVEELLSEPEKKRSIDDLIAEHGRYRKFGHTSSFITEQQDKIKELEERLKKADEVWNKQEKEIERLNSEIETMGKTLSYYRYQSKRHQELELNLALKRTERDEKQLFNEVKDLMGRGTMTIPITVESFRAQLRRAERRFDFLVSNIIDKHGVIEIDIRNRYEDFYIREVVLCYCKVLKNEIDNRFSHETNQKVENDYMMTQAQQIIDSLEIDIEQAFSR